MKYKYLLEERVNKNASFDDILNNQDSCILNIICYHVENQYKYPFLQFMMEKVPFCNNIVAEQLIFPYIFVRKTEKNDIIQWTFKNKKQFLNSLLEKRMTIIVIAEKQFTRPNDTTTYASGDLVADSATAASVTPIAFDLGKVVYNNCFGILLATIKRQFPYKYNFQKN